MTKNSPYHSWLLENGYLRKECRKCNYTMYAKVKDHKCNKCGGTINTIEEKNNEQ